MGGLLCKMMPGLKMTSGSLGIMGAKRGIITK